MKTNDEMAQEIVDVALTLEEEFDIGPAEALRFIIETCEDALRRVGLCPACGFSPDDCDCAIET